MEMNENIKLRRFEKEDIMKLSSIILFALVVLAPIVGCASQNQSLHPLPSSTIPADKSIDMRGKSITVYILYHAVQAFQQMDEAEILEIVTDNYEAIENDIQAWSRVKGYTLLGVETGTDFERFFIRKNQVNLPGKKMAMVISNPGLEELLSPLGFALSAALGGMDVHIYFQGPAVRVFENGFSEKLGGFSRPFSGFARQGLSEAGHLPPQEKIKQLKELGAHFYLCGPSMQYFKVEKDNLIIDSVVIAEYMTFMEVMWDADIQWFIP